MPADGVSLPVVFVDFDGTITQRDTTDAILEAFADPRWRDIEAAWTSGAIGSRDCLLRQMALVDASREELDALLDRIAIDDGFVPLLETCAARGVALHIVSDSFDYCIDRILRRPSLELSSHLTEVQIVSSHLEPHSRRWRVGFGSVGSPCDHGCATCKPAVMARLNPGRRPLVYVGDGYSDRHAAPAADLLFAKRALAAYCDGHAIPYVPYEDLATVARELADVFQANAPLKGRDLLYD